MTAFSEVIGTSMAERQRIDRYRQVLPVRLMGDDYDKYLHNNRTSDDGEWAGSDETMSSENMAQDLKSWPILRKMGCV